MTPVTAERRGSSSARTAKTRRIMPLVLSTWALALGIALGAVPHQAVAKNGRTACQATNIKAKPGCVRAEDIGTKGKGKKKKPALSQDDRKDEAGVLIDDKPLENTRVLVIGGAPPTKVFTGFDSKVPAQGWIVVRASAVLDSIGDVQGAVKCDILATGTVFDNRTIRINGFAGSIDVVDGFPTDTMAFLTAFEVEKEGTLELDLVCGIFTTLGLGTNANDQRQILMKAPNLVAQYFPTRY